MTRNSIWKRRMRDSMNAPASPIEIGTTRKNAVHRMLCSIASQNAPLVNIVLKFVTPMNFAPPMPVQLVNE